MTPAGAGKAAGDDVDREPLDLLSPDGRPVGRTKPRGRVHRDGDWHRSVHIWLLNDRGEVLLQKRHARKDTHPGLWDVSCAGHLTAGDDSRRAAVRELGEELGVRARAGALRLIFRRRTRFFLRGGTLRDNEWTAVYLLRHHAGLDRMRPQPGEVAALRWMPARELRRRYLGRDPSLVPHGREYEHLLALTPAGRRWPGFRAVGRLRNRISERRRYSLTRSTYSPVRVSIFRRSPSLTNGGT